MVLAPAYFIENLHFTKEQLAKGIHATPPPPMRQLAQVALADIGAVSVRLLEDPGRFAGKRFDLASDELMGNDVLAMLSRVTGRPFTPLDLIRQRMGEDGAKLYEWIDRVGYTVDRAALRREFPDVAFHDFESGVKAQDWNTFLQAA
jgi:NmrA-like family